MSGTPPPPPTADVVTITPIAGMTATNVQQALEELQTSKQTTRPAPMTTVSVGAGVAANPNVPHIDQPQTELGSLRTVATQLRQGVESLGGHRGGMLDRAVTLQDLVSLGLVTTADIYGRLPGTSRDASRPRVVARSPRIR